MIHTTTTLINVCSFSKYKYIYIILFMFLLSFILADTSTHSMIRRSRGPFKFSSTFFRKDYIQLVIGNLVESLWSHLEFKNIQIFGSKIKFLANGSNAPSGSLSSKKDMVHSAGKWAFWFSNKNVHRGLEHQLKENILTPFL